MRIDQTSDLGLYIKSRRKELGWSQTRLAEVAGVSRRWITALENGKSTVDFGLILGTLAALDLIAEVNLRPLPPGGVDLDKLLATFRRGGEHTE
jgi:HTH-type transcriptional regulator / antitoxin HipB